MASATSLWGTPRRIKGCSSWTCSSRPRATGNRCQGPPAICWGSGSAWARSERRARPARPRGAASWPIRGRRAGGGGAGGGGGGGGGAGGAGGPPPPPLQHVAGQLGQLLGDGGEGGAFHLPELDGQHLQQVAIRVGGGGAPAVGWGHQTPGDVEPDGPLVGVGAGRGVDGADARRVEDGAGHGRQGAGPPISPASGVVPPRPPPRGGAARAEPARTASSAWVDRGGAASRGGPRLRGRRASR